MLCIKKIHADSVIDFAAEELKKYLRMMMTEGGDVPISYDPDAVDGFRLGLLEDFGLENTAEDPFLDDIVHVDTTSNGGDSDGALTITCTDRDGRTIKIRTASKLIVVEDGKNVIITASNVPKGTVISVKGVIDSYNGEYQIKVFAYNDITFEVA